MKHRFVPKLYVCVCGLVISFEECFQPPRVSWQHQETGQHLTRTLEGITQIETQVCFYYLKLYLWFGDIVWGVCQLPRMPWQHKESRHHPSRRHCSGCVASCCLQNTRTETHVCSQALFVGLLFFGWGGGGGVKNVNCIVN